MPKFHIGDRIRRTTNYDGRINPDIKYPSVGDVGAVVGFLASSSIPIVKFDRAEEFHFSYCLNGTHNVACNNANCELYIDSPMHEE